jgi:hypothetical protein
MWTLMFWVVTLCCLVSVYSVFEELVTLSFRAEIHLLHLNLKTSTDAEMLN